MTLAVHHYRSAPPLPARHDVSWQRILILIILNLISMSLGIILLYFDTTMPRCGTCHLRHRSSINTKSYSTIMTQQTVPALGGRRCRLPTSNTRGVKLMDARGAGLSARGMLMHNLPSHTVSERRP